MTRLRPALPFALLTLWMACTHAPIVGDDAAAFQAHCDRGLRTGSSPASQEIHAGACYEAGRAYLQGQGVTADPVRGVAYLEQACALMGLGARESCAALGEVRLSGAAGVPVDPIAAGEAFARACTLELDTGCLRAGVLFDGQSGHPRDVSRALAFYELGCDRGSGDACTFAASTLATEAGLRSLPKALERAARGCGLKHGPSCWLASELTSDPAEKKRFRAEACGLGEACGDGAR